MTFADLERLRSYTDKRVRIVATDGEILLAKIILMQDEYQDFICDVIDTNRDGKYKQPLNSASYTILYNDVVAFELAEGTC
jgi:hypothetical protein